VLFSPTSTNANKHTFSLQHQCGRHWHSTEKELRDLHPYLRQARER
jgi:hypothetical protein